MTRLTISGKPQIIDDSRFAEEIPCGVYFLADSFQWAGNEPIPIAPGTILFPIREGEFYLMKADSSGPSSLSWSKQKTLSFKGFKPLRNLDIRYTEAV